MFLDISPAYTSGILSARLKSIKIDIKKLLNNNQSAIAAIELYENRLARGLAMIVNILDPEIIVLAGGVSNIERLYPNVKKNWNKYIISTGEEVVTPIVQAKHGDSSGVRGAAWLWPEI